MGFWHGQADDNSQKRKKPLQSGEMVSANFLQGVEPGKKEREEEEEEVEEKEKKKLPIVVMSVSLSDIFDITARDDNAGALGLSGRITEKKKRRIEEKKKSELQKLFKNLCKKFCKKIKKKNGGE